ADAEVSRLRNEKLRLEAAAKEAAATLAALKEEGANTRKRLKEKDAEVAQARKEMDEEDKIGKGRVNSKGNLETGQGPRWKALKAIYDLRVTEQTNLKAAVKTLEANIAVAYQKSQDADTELQKVALGFSNAE